MTKAIRNKLGKFSRRALPSAISYYDTQSTKLNRSGVWRDAIFPFHNWRIHLKHKTDNKVIRPIRINGRLAWKVADLRALLNGGV
jgi:hypothetical protein